MGFDSDDQVLTTGTWQHVAVTFDGAVPSIKMYVNGSKFPPR